MFSKWFGTRRTNTPERNHSFRPRLEVLEDRLAPSTLMPFDKGGGDDNGNGHGHKHGPPPPVAVGGSINTSANHSFNGSTITDSFNNTINNTIILMPAQQASVDGLFLLSNLLSTTLGNPQLGSLLNDEVALAVDKYLDAFPPVAAAIPTLPGDISTLQAAIAANPLGNTPIGHAIGTLAFNATLTALTTAQPTI